LRIVDELEERYADFRGLNLSWEVREGIVKHTPPYTKPLAAAFAPGEAPCLEAQLVDCTDEIAYNSHDIDDGLKSGLLTFEQLDGVSLWRETYRSVRDRYPQANQRIWRYQAIRLIIDRMVTDLIETLEQRLASERIRSLDDLRAYGRPLAGHGEALEAQRLELKRFLMANLYRHYRVMRMAEKAKRVMSDLFNAFLSEPRQLPPHILARRELGDSLPRVVADYIAGMTDRYVLEEHSKLFDAFEKG
ncbi:MAG: deoxyguanosinetriphosphate triphosphohydrolase, partial [bacterium]